MIGKPTPRTPLDRERVESDFSSSLFPSPRFLAGCFSLTLEVTTASRKCRSAMIRQRLLQNAASVFNATINLAGRHTKERRGYFEWEHLNRDATKQATKLTNGEQANSDQLQPFVRLPVTASITDLGQVQWPSLQACKEDNRSMCRRTTMSSRARSETIAQG